MCFTPTMETICRRVHEYINADYDRNGIPVKPGLYDLLDWLQARQIPCAVATSSSRHRDERILRQSRLAGRFDVIVCGDDITRSKPDPQIFELACQDLGASPRSALVLEDSQAGIEASYRADIPVICVIDLKVPEDEYEKKTLQTVRSLEDVKAWLNKVQESEANSSGSVDC